MPAPLDVRRFFVVLVALDLMLVALNFRDAHSFLAFDEESNFTTWYSSAKLLLAALAALWCSSLAPAARRGFLALAAILAFMSMDETATAHERLATWLMESPPGAALRERVGGGDAAKDAFLWPVLFAPVIVAVFFFFFAFLGRQLRREPRLLGAAIAGSLLLVLAVVLEGGAVYASAPVGAWGAAEVARYQWFSLVEETAEVAGATLLLLALSLHASRLAEGG